MTRSARTFSRCTAKHISVRVPAGLAPASEPVRYLVVDHAQRLADSALPGILLRLHELSGAALPSAPLGPAAGSTADAQHIFTVLGLG